MARPRPAPFDVLGLRVASPQLRTARPSGRSPRRASRTCRGARTPTAPRGIRYRARRGGRARLSPRGALLVRDRRRPRGSPPGQVCAGPRVAPDALSALEGRSGTPARRSWSASRVGSRRRRLLNGSRATTHPEPPHPLRGGSRACGTRQPSNRPGAPRSAAVRAPSALRIASSSSAVPGSSGQSFCSLWRASRLAASRNCTASFAFMWTASRGRTAAAIVESPSRKRSARLTLTASEGIGRPYS